MSHPAMPRNRSYSADAVQPLATLLEGARHILLHGAAGVGKSMLAARLSAVLHEQGRRCWCLSADPGTPAFGLPGALSLGRWRDNQWQVQAMEPLCTLDAGRFRLPLISAANRLFQQWRDDEKDGRAVLFIDAPGVVRAVAGSELLQNLVSVLDADTILSLYRQGSPPLAEELAAVNARVIPVTPAPGAARPGKRAREQSRSARWDRYLAGAEHHSLEAATTTLIGTPPPRRAEAAWRGRQVAVFDGQSAPVLAEVVAMTDGELTLRAPVSRIDGGTVLVRDATRNQAGRLVSAEPWVEQPVKAGATGAARRPAVDTRVGICDVSLVNGLFGDPLLHARIRHQGRSLLFDLGEGQRLSARVAHQVSDVFISHAHMDHLGGFQWLLRSRVGYPAVCRLYGPPGLADHIEAQINGFLWDRIGEAGPRFEVAELHGQQLKRCYLQAGIAGRRQLPARDIANGIVLREAAFHVQAVALDHHTPVLAFALQAAQTINIRKDRLAARGLAPGPWLSDFKAALRAGEWSKRIVTPDGRAATVAQLDRELVLMTPGKKFAYATDLDDTPANRRRLVALARDAHTLFCEAPFIQAERSQAQKHGHLTARACGEIAAEAQVTRLLPFHFSRRHEADPEPVVAELKSAFSRVEVAWP